MTRGGTLPGAWSGAWRRRAAWLVFAAYLPSLLFLGHWELQLDIPGTRYYVGLPQLPHTHAAHDHSAHAQHCHADLGSCSDLPLVTTAPVAVLAAVIETPPDDSRAFPAPADTWRPHHAATSSPEVPPPRGA